MVAAQPPICDFRWKAIDFSLPGVDGKDYSLGDVMYAVKRQGENSYLFAYATAGLS